MARHASTLIIGGGVIGASVAWHLARRGLKDIVMLDAGSGPGAGSTGRATGGYRAQFSTAINVRLSLLSRSKLSRFADETGVDPRYRPVGYLFLAHDPSALAAFRAARAVQHAAGLTEATELAVDDIPAINPHVRLDGVVGGAWCPTDGTIRPLEILRGYLTDATRLGVRIEWGQRVRGIDRDAAGRIVAVRTEHEVFTADTVVNAAGAWAGGVAGMAGVTLPVTPSRRQIAVTGPLRGLDDGFPMTIWTSDAFHLRVRDGRALLNWPIDAGGGDPFELRVDPLWVEDTWSKARARVPALAHSTLDEGAHWAGLYEMTPDKTVILGLAPGCPNLLLVNGSSGHGVMHSPILGELAAELVLDGQITTLDARPLRPERFAEGDPNPVNDLL